MLSPHAKSEWTTIFVIGVLLSATAVLAGWWWLSIPLLIFTACLILFFRDPDRPIPTQRGIVVAPADGKVSSIHEVEYFEPFNGPATCVRIFLSVFDVHINRSPIHGVVTSITHKPGQHLSVLNPESAEVNEANLIILAHPVRRDNIAAIRQVAGQFARTICCTLNTGSVVQRGQRIGLIKLGSTTELYIPGRFNPQVVVEQGQYVYGGTTILANINLGPVHDGDEEEEVTSVASDVQTPTETEVQEPAAVDAATEAPTVALALPDAVDLDEEVQVESEADDAQSTDALDAIDEEATDEIQSPDASEIAEESEENEEDEDTDYTEEPDAEELEEESEADDAVDEVEDALTEESTQEESEEDEPSEQDDTAEALADEDESASTDEADEEEISDEVDEDVEVEEEQEEEEEEEAPVKKQGKKKSGNGDDAPMLF